MSTVDPHTPEAKRSIGGYDITVTTTRDLLAKLDARLAARDPTELFFANTNFVLGCRTLAGHLGAPQSIVVNDGIGMDLASLLVHGTRFRENLNGTDFTPTFLEARSVPTRVYLFGAKPAVVRKAASVWAALPQIDIVGISDGFDDAADNDAVLDRLNQSKPDVLLLALGNPRQERWAIENRGRHAVPLVVAVGALFDFAAGEFLRAPAWMRKARLEWAYRLHQEPKRLLRRYSIDLVAFFLHCLRTRNAVTSRPVGS